MLDTIAAYSLNWHLKNSPAAYRLLVEPLKPYAKIELLGEYSDLLYNKRFTRGCNPSIFFQILPPAPLLNNPNAQLIWIPMLDSVNGMTQEWWDRLPKHLRIVVFSETLARQAIAAGLQILQLKYFLNPKDFQKASWENGRVLFYWNRVGLARPNFLEKLCRTLDIKKLIFRDNIDPGLPQSVRFNLPARLGNTIVHHVEICNQKEYIDVLKSANIYIAPRPFEGVGLSFLEAMCSGCMVIAKDSPTMNEYIIHKETGCLLSRTSKTQQGDHWLYWFDETQEWESISALDTETIGQKTYEENCTGYQRWQEQIESYARFILDW